MLTKGAILCGGEGRRLKPLTDYFQKTMIPIGARRRPLLEYAVRLLAFHKVNDIVMLTGYRFEEIENYFGDGSRFGARMNYSRDVTAGGGSANALEHAFASGKMGDFDNLLVYYGDILSDLNVTELLAVHKAKSAAITLVLSDRYTLPVGVADVVDGFVRRFREKPSLGLSVTTGCMVVTREALGILGKATSRGGRRDLMAHFVPEVLEKGERVAAYYSRGLWYDVGTTEAYEKLENRIVETHLRFLG
jgi:mannose-1-phosphate guanylyltransferase